MSDVTTARDMHYLAVPESAREAMEQYAPVYGETLEDGKTVCKVQMAIKKVPNGAERLGKTALEVHADERVIAVKALGRQLP